MIIKEKKSNLKLKLKQNKQTKKRPFQIIKFKKNIIIILVIKKILFSLIYIYIS